MLPTTKTPKRLDPRKMTICLYGRPKIGKSSLAAEFGDSVLFIATEPGLAGLEVFQLPCSDWETFIGAIQDLAKGDHGFTTIAIDVVDELRGFALDFVERRDGLSIEKHTQSVRAYGKANKMISDALRVLQLCNVGIVFISHERTHQVDQSGAIVGAFDKNTGPLRERVFPSVSGRVRDHVLGMSDLILRYSMDEKTGQRTLQTKPTPDVEAGERFGILDPIIRVGNSPEAAHSALIEPFRNAWKADAG